jgi:HlyD family secretion protein
MQKDIFRKVSLARIASPEQLDQLLRVTAPKNWLSLLALFLLLGMAMVWGFTGSLPTKVSGYGVIVRTGGVLNVVAPAPGMVTSLRARIGDHIRANQVIAQLAQPERMTRIQAAREAIEEVRHERDRSLARLREGAHLEVGAIERQRADIRRQIKEYQDRAVIAADNVTVVDQLLKKGLVTRQALIDAQQKQVEVAGKIAQLETDLTQLDAKQFSTESQPLTQDAEMASRLAELERNLAGLTKDLAITANVVSPYGGEVIELKVDAGSMVVAGAPLLSIQPSVKDLELLIYLPAAQAKDAKPGMQVQISPSTVKRQEYGFMRGTVAFVSDYPATPAALMRNFQNEALVSELTNKGPVTEVRIAMTLNPTTPSGFQWSSSKGPPITITSGSICTADIVTREQKPIKLLFPSLGGS